MQKCEFGCRVSLKLYFEMATSGYYSDLYLIHVCVDFPFVIRVFSVERY